MHSVVKFCAFLKQTITTLRLLHRLFDSEQSLEGKLESAEKEMIWLPGL